MKKFIRVMKALSDPSRIKIMKILQEKELCVCEITGVLGLAQSTISKHLKILEDAELVDSRREGAWVNYKLSANTGNQYAAVLKMNLREWLGDDPQIQKAITLTLQADRTSICQESEVKRI